MNDGEPSRGHRKNIFRKEMNLCGISSGDHAAMENITLIEYCNGILKEGELPSINITVQEEVP